MENPHQTRQNENSPAPEEAQDQHDFGNWPELLGIFLTALIVWLTFAFTG